MTTACRAEPVQLANVIRWLLNLPAPWRIALKLAALAAALPLIYLGLRHSNVITGALGALTFGMLWLYHGATSGFSYTNGASVYSVNPASGEAIMPGTQGLSSSGMYTGAGQ